MRKLLFVLLALSLYGCDDDVGGKILSMCGDQMCGDGKVCVGEKCKEKCAEGVGGDCGCGKIEDGYKVCGKGEVCKFGKCGKKGDVKECTQEDIGKCQAEGKLVCEDGQCKCKDGGEECGDGKVCVGEECKAKCSEGVGGDCVCGKDNGPYKACGEGQKCSKDGQCMCVDGKVIGIGEVCQCGEGSGVKECVGGNVCKDGKCKAVCVDGKAIGEGEDCQCGEGKKDLCGGGNVCVSGACKEKCDDKTFVNCGCGNDTDGYKSCGNNEVCVSGACKKVCEDGQVIGDGKSCLCGKGSNAQDCGGPGSVCKDDKCIRVCGKRELVGDDKQVGKDEGCGCPEKEDSSKVKNICKTGEICRDGGCEKCDGLSALQSVKRVCAVKKGSEKSLLQLMECEKEEKGKEKWKWKVKETCHGAELCADTWGCVMGCNEEEGCKKNGIESGNECKSVKDFIEDTQDGKLQVVENNSEVTIKNINSICTCSGNSDFSEILGCREGSKCVDNGSKKKCEFEDSSSKKDVCRADEKLINLGCHCNSQVSDEPGDGGSCPLGQVCKMGESKPGCQNLTVKGE